MATKKKAKKTASRTTSKAKKSPTAASPKKPKKKPVAKRPKKAATKATKRAAAHTPKKALAKKPKKVAKPAAASKAQAATKPAKLKTRATKTRSKMRAPARRDASGHLNPGYAADLRRMSRATAESKDGGGFVRGTHSDDDLAEQLGEEFVETVTSGENEGADVLDQEVPEERGGPFVVTSARTEFARGTDLSNPRGARREPFPRT